MSGEDLYSIYKRARGQIERRNAEEDDRKKVAEKKFIPAKTVKEATEWTKKNRGTDVNWRGMDLDSVNIINSEMDSLAKDFPILKEKYKTVGSNSKMKCIAHANNALVEFSPKSINKDAIAKEFENNKNRAADIQKKITFYTKHPRFYGEKYSKKEIAKLEEELKFSRYGVGDDWGDPEKYVRGVVVHESGHTILYRKALKQIAASGKIKKTHPIRGEYEVYKTTIEETDAYMAVNDAFKQAKKTGDIYKVSEYGNTTMHEFFAETFVMYRFEKEKLSDYIINMIEEVVK